jgi:hypothetical protein
MPKENEEEIEGEEDEEEDEDDEDEEEEDDEEQDQAEVLDMIAESLQAAMEECVEADVVNDSYIELQLNDGKKWKISIKQID